MRAILVSTGAPPERSARAVAKLAEIRTEHSLSADLHLDLVPDAYGQRLWTLPAARPTTCSQRHSQASSARRSPSTTSTSPSGARPPSSEVAIRQAIDQLRTERRPNHEDALRFAELCGRGRLSKFQPCLPERLESEYLAEVLTDEAEALAALK